MTDPLHHKALVNALKDHWRDAGGPVSLSSFLKECRPTIASLLTKNIRWDWIGARVLAVYKDPHADVPVELPLLGDHRKTLIELYSRVVRNNPDVSVSKEGDATEKGKSETEDQNSDEMPKRSSAPNSTVTKPRSGTDPPAARRARIRKSGGVRQKLEKPPE